MFEYLIQSAWNELRPALIIYGTIFGGAWALIALNEQFNFFS